MKKPGQWWDKSWNIVTGCSWPEGEVPEGCRNCWARAMTRRFGHLHGGTLPRKVDGVTISDAGPGFDKVICHEDRLMEWLHHRKPTVYAVSLLGDLFHPDVPTEFIVWAFRVMSERVHSSILIQPNFVVLTKRPLRAVDFFKTQMPTWPLNVILMASVWDQRSADNAIKYLAPLNMQKGLHIEPMLGPIKLPSLIVGSDEGTYHHLLNWIVVGGENGPGARPFKYQWALDIVNQCTLAGVPFWLKGHGTNGEQTGRLLDGCEFNQTPWAKR
jgi:protein gp37